MAQFNPYLWDLYSSGKGQSVINRFRSFLNGEYNGFGSFIGKLMASFCPDRGHISETSKSINHAISLIQAGKIQIPQYQPDSITTDEQFEAMADESLLELSERYAQALRNTGSAVQAQWNISLDMGGIVTELALIYPDTFVPYYFTACFNVLNRIAAYYDVELPAIPAKGQKEKRVLYLANSQRSGQNSEERMG